VSLRIALTALLFEFLQDNGRLRWSELNDIRACNEMRPRCYRPRAFVCSCNGLGQANTADRHRGGCRAQMQPNHMRLDIDLRRDKMTRVERNPKPEGCDEQAIA
jgi:hypothetical protein